MRTFNEINIRLPKPLKLKKKQNKSMYVKDDSPLRIFLESTFFVVVNINLLSSITFLALGLIKINKSKHLCFTIDNIKNGNTQKEEMKANNETKTHPARLRHIIEKHKKVFFLK